MIGTHTDGMTPTQKEAVSQELSRVIETWRYAFRGTSIQLIADEVRRRQRSSLLFSLERVAQ